MRDSSVIHPMRVDASNLRCHFRRTRGRVLSLFIVVLMDAYGGICATEVMGETAARALNQVKVEAQARGIPTKVIDEISDDPNFKVEAKNYSGEKTAGYAPSENTMRISKKTFDDYGNVIPQQAVDPSRVMEDVFHEGFHHKWKVDNMANDPDMKKLAGKAKEEYKKLKKIELTDQQAMEVVEEAIAVKFGTLVGAAYFRSGEVADVGLKKTKEGAAQKEVKEAMDTKVEGIESSLQGILNSPGNAYCNDYPEMLTFDIGEIGKKYIQDALLGIPIEVFISRVQRWAVVHAKQKTFSSGWGSIQSGSSAKSFQPALGQHGFGNTPPETAAEKGKRELERHEMPKMQANPANPVPPAKCP
jgi:hypothetical protein